MNYACFGKRGFIPFICAVLLFAASLSSAQPKKHNVEVESIIKKKTQNAKEEFTAVDKGLKYIETTTTGKIENCTLTVTLKNDETAQKEVQLEWYFLSDNVKGTGTETMREKPVLGFFDTGRKKLSLEAESTTTHTIKSKPLVLKEISTYTVDDKKGKDKTLQTEQGDTYVGYIVLVTVDGEVIAKDASSYPYMKDDWIERCRNHR